MEYRTNFHICMKPHSINFECPHCNSEAVIMWRELDVPSHYDDDWGVVECPECGEFVVLGDYDYD